MEEFILIYFTPSKLFSDNWQLVNRADHIFFKNHSEVEVELEERLTLAKSCG